MTDAPAPRTRPDMRGVLTLFIFLAGFGGMIWALGSAAGIF